MNKFKLISNYKPTGDQPQAIEELTKGLENSLSDQVLLGVTGSGKTFTIANVIQNVQKPTLVISHNKTLAAQLYQEFRDFFPHNAVEYFVSYYDYYQPEAYIPQTDTYIEKDASINEEIDKLRLSTTSSLLTRSDVIVVASVSCIYNLGSPIEYGQRVLRLKANSQWDNKQLSKELINLYYERSDYDLKRGTFRIRGEVIDIWPSYLDLVIRLELSNGQIKKIQKIHPVSGKLLEVTRFFILYPAKHYITAEDKKEKALKQIRTDLKKQMKKFKDKRKLLEANRLGQKTNYDLTQIEEFGYCSGIENYSRYFDGRNPGEPPYTLLDYFILDSRKIHSRSQDPLPESIRPTPGVGLDSGSRSLDYLLIIDESHMTIPQIRGMYAGDHSRKETLIKYGFRLPSALDNRPLKFDEFLKRMGQTIYVSATPGEWEIHTRSQRPSQDPLPESIRPTPGVDLDSGSGPNRIVEQLIRPTGLLDPKIIVRKTKGQVNDLIREIEKRVKRGERILVTTLTKRLAEDLSEFLSEKAVRVHYLHSDIDTLDRSDILDDLRLGKYDVVVGINLLREGLDLPEVSLVAILDADKEGFLRSETALIQTMGRAARHIHGEVIMYADKITFSMEKAVKEVERRRRIQLEYNKKHKITPKSIQKPVREKLIRGRERGEKKAKGRKKSKGFKYSDLPIISKLLDLQEKGAELSKEEKQKLIRVLNYEMTKAAKNLEFEKAAEIRDRIERIT